MQKYVRFEHSDYKETVFESDGLGRRCRSIIVVSCFSSRPPRFGSRKHHTHPSHFRQELQPVIFKILRTRKVHFHKRGDATREKSRRGISARGGAGIRICMGDAR